VLVRNSSKHQNSEGEGTAQTRNKRETKALKSAREAQARQSANAARSAGTGTGGALAAALQRSNASNSNIITHYQTPQTEG
jgi:hypothetical protein